MFLIPDYMFTDYAAVTPELLRSLGVTLLLCDLDYTLAPKSQREPDTALLAWVAALRDAGVAVEVVSNNRSGRRVARFCGALGVGCVGHAGKPSARGYRAAMAKHGALPAQTAALGDKLLTDVLASRRAGVAALMVEPNGGPVGAWNRLLHAMQEPFKRACAHDRRGAN